MTPTLTQPPQVMSHKANYTSNTAQFASHTFVPDMDKVPTIPAQQLGEMESARAPPDARGSPGQGHPEAGRSLACP